MLHEWIIELHSSTLINIVMSPYGSQNCSHHVYIQHATLDDFMRVGCLWMTAFQIKKHPKQLVEVCRSIALHSIYAPWMHIFARPMRNAYMWSSRVLYTCARCVLNVHCLSVPSFSTCRNNFIYACRGCIYIVYYCYINAARNVLMPELFKTPLALGYDTRIHVCDTKGKTSRRTYHLLSM